MLSETRSKRHRQQQQLDCKTTTIKTQKKKERKRNTSKAIKKNTPSQTTKQDTKSEAQQSNKALHLQTMAKT